MNKPNRTAQTKLTNKLEPYHVDFILKKVAEGTYSNQEIADLFNDVYGKSVKITRQAVVYYACSGKFDDRIYDIRQLLSKEVNKNCKFANLSVQLSVISKGIEHNIQKSNYKEVHAGIELISKLTGQLIKKTEVKQTAFSREELREIAKEVQEKRSLFLAEYCEEDEQDDMDVESC